MGGEKGNGDRLDFASSVEEFGGGAAERHYPPGFVSRAAAALERKKVPFNCLTGVERVIFRGIGRADLTPDILLEVAAEAERYGSDLVDMDEVKD